jgi:hypothetical protein
LDDLSKAIAVHADQVDAGLETKRLCVC